MIRKKNLFSIIATLLLSTTLVKVLNFLKEIQISFFYGTDNIVDQFNIIMIGPNLALSTIAPAFGLILVSYLSGEKKELILTVKELFFIGISIVFLFLVSITSQINYGDINYIGVLFSIFISVLFFIQVITVYYLHSFQAFNQGSVSSIIQIIINILVISFSIFFKSYILLLTGLTIGLVAQLIFLFYVIKSRKLYSKLMIGNKENNDFYHSFFSIVLGYGLIELLISLQKSFAVGLKVEGLISAINYSYKVMNLPISIFLFAVLSVLFPMMNRVKNTMELNEISTKLLSGIAFIMLPFTILLFFHSEFIISVLFERGNFNHDSVSITSYQLKCFSLMLLPLSIFSAQLRVIYVKKEWKKIYYSALIIMLISISLNYLSVLHTNNLLFSLSLPISYSVAVIIILKGNIKQSVNRDLICTLLASSVILVLSILLSNYLFIEDIISMVIISVLYILIQFVLKNTMLLKLLRR